MPMRAYPQSQIPTMQEDSLMKLVVTTNDGKIITTFEDAEDLDYVTRSKNRPR